MIVVFFCCSESQKPNFVTVNSIPTVHIRDEACAMCPALRRLFLMLLYYVFIFYAGGKPLTGDMLRNHLKGIFERFARNSERLAPCGSSQANESLNNTIASKNPKARHYGASESMDFRVAASVCVKNLGPSYVTEVNTRVGLSPGQTSEKYRQLVQKAREKRALKAKTTDFKRQRQRRKTLRCRKRLALDNREGITYSTECALDGVASLPDEPAVTREF